MRHRLLTVSVVVMVLLTACGGGDDAETPASQPSAVGRAVLTATSAVTAAPTTPAAATEGAPVVDPQATTTSSPAETPVTDSAGTAIPETEVATASPPEATAETIAGTAVVVEGTAASEPTQRSTPARTAKFVDADSPLAIPARLLRAYGLKLNTNLRDQENEGLNQFNGRVTLANLWAGTQQQPKGLVLAWDFRFTFDTERNAHRAYADLLQSVNKDELSPGVRLKKIPGEQDYGDEGAAFEATNPQTGGTFYLVAFRTEDMVAYVILGGDKTFTRKKALPLFRAADRQVDQAVR